jgi:hypothetical protein
MPESLLQSLVFIYPNEQSARKDAGFIGAGFIVGVPSPQHPTFHIHYIITNHHIIEGLKHVSLRLNLKSGGFQIIKNVPHKAWTINKKVDLAVLPAPTAGNVFDFDFSFVSLKAFIDPDKIAKHKIGAGDEVCLIGRVVRSGMNYKQRNIAVLRFGNIALTPQYEETMYLVELRSISGHSGSPAIVYCPPYSISDSRRKEHMWDGVVLLGVNRGHLREFEEIVSIKDLKTRSQHWVSQTNMAMSQIVPAWHIAELLNAPTLVEQRAALHAQFAERMIQLREDRETKQSTSQKPEPEQ